MLQLLLLLLLIFGFSVGFDYCRGMDVKAAHIHVVPSCSPATVERSCSRNSHHYLMTRQDCYINCMCVRGGGGVVGASYAVPCICLHCTVLVPLVCNAL